MRDWLLVIVILLILGIALDGLRRMRAHRRNSLKLNEGEDDDPDANADLHLPSEFPSGGARVAGYRDPDDVHDIYKNLKETHAASKKTRGAPARPAVRAAKPTLEAASAERGGGRGAKTGAREPVIGNLSDLDSETADADEQRAWAGKPAARRLDCDWEQPVHEDDDWLEPASGQAAETHGAAKRRAQQFVGDGLAAEPDRYDQGPDALEPDAASESDVILGLTPLPEQNLEPEEEYLTEPEPEMEYQTEPEPEPEQEPEQQPHAVEQPARPADAPDEVLIINVMSRRGNTFAGAELLQAMLDEGLRFGEMDIFHRHHTTDGEGPILFSVANMVKPGTFDLSAMENFATPGISMFLTLPIRGDSLAAYTLMADTARHLAEQLDGELKDENRSVMTRQTIEHGRQRVIEYERKRRLVRA